MTINNDEKLSETFGMFGKSSYADAVMQHRLPELGTNAKNKIFYCFFRKTDSVLGK